MLSPREIANAKMLIAMTEKSTQPAIKKDRTSFKIEKQNQGKSKWDYFLQAEIAVDLDSNQFIMLQKKSNKTKGDNIVVENGNDESDNY